MDDQLTAVSAETPIRADLVLLYRIDEGESNAPLVGSDNGDMLYELEITNDLKELWVEGAGGGGGGGGGAAGAGPGKGRGGSGTGGNGAYCTAAFKISLRRGDKLSIRLGHGGHGGVGSPALQNYGSTGQRGGDTILSVNGAVLLTFVGSNGGGGGQFTGGEHHSPVAGPIGDTKPPSGIPNYFYAAGGVLGKKGTDVTLPFGGRGGVSGGGGGGGGGGASLRGTGGRGGHYVEPCTNVFMGISGHFGSGGGGGAGGGPRTCDLGGPGGSGGLGYVWIYQPA